jgi:glycosyltransferase involved in cell wall biosynthesis
VTESTPDISVVVPVRDGERYLHGLLSAIDEQTLDRDRYEVLVVDDASGDTTAEIVASWAGLDPARRQLLRSKGYGPGHARNIGIGAARGEWIAFTDSDTLPDPTWLEAALEAVRTLGVAALEGAVEPWPHEAMGPYTHQIVTEAGGRYMTANMVYRRDLLTGLGGFDERFEQPFLEDSDLAFRVIEAGYEIPFVPQVRVRHHVRFPSMLETLRSTRKLRWIALFAGKHPELYRTRLRPIVRPLPGVDIDVLLGLAALAAALRARGPVRLVLLGVAANGMRRGLASAEVLDGAPAERAARAALALTLPVARAFWWLEGCIRFGRAVW